MTSICLKQLMLINLIFSMRLLFVFIVLWCWFFSGFLFGGGLVHFRFQFGFCVRVSNKLWESTVFVNFKLPMMIDVVFMRIHWLLPHYCLPSEASLSIPISLVICFLVAFWLLNLGSWISALKSWFFTRFHFVTLPTILLFSLSPRKSGGQMMIRSIVQMTHLWL